MAIDTGAPDQEDKVWTVCGSEHSGLAQDPNDRLEGVMYGAGGQAISQDANGNLEALLKGNEDIAVDQESGTGKIVLRIGGDAGESDIDIGSASSPVNIGTGGSEFQSGQRSTGGAQELALTVVSASSATFDVNIDWMDENGNVLRTESPSAAQGVTDVEKLTIITVSDNFQLRITDASGNTTNNVHGSANAH